MSVLIVTYRSASHIANCLSSLSAAYDSGEIEVIVVDNASDDGTDEVVRTGFPWARFVSAGANLGFARANNLAMRLSRGVRLLILNPDTVVPPSAIERLVDTLDADASIAVVAPRLVNVDGSDQQTARMFPTPAAAVFGRRSPVSRVWPTNPWTKRYLEPKDQDPFHPYSVDWVSGACFLIRRDVALASGGFDNGFFLYWEDADWCRRLNESGLRVVCEPRTTIVHDEGARRNPSGSQVRAFHRSAYRYYAKHHLCGYWLLLRPVARAALSGRASCVLISRQLAHSVQARRAKSTADGASSEVYSRPGAEP